MNKSKQFNKSHTKLPGKHKPHAQNPQSNPSQTLSLKTFQHIRHTRNKSSPNKHPPHRHHPILMTDLCATQKGKIGELILLVQDQSDQIKSLNQKIVTLQTENQRLAEELSDLQSKQKSRKELKTKHQTAVAEYQSLLQIKLAQIEQLKAIVNQQEANSNVQYFDTEIQTSKSIYAEISTQTKSKKTGSRATQTSEIRTSQQLPIQSNLSKPKVHSKSFEKVMAQRNSNISIVNSSQQQVPAPHSYQIANKTGGISVKQQGNTFKTDITPKMQEYIPNGSQNITIHSFNNNTGTNNTKELYPVNSSLILKKQGQAENKKQTDQVKTKKDWVEKKNIATFQDIADEIEEGADISRQRWSPKIQINGQRQSSPTQQPKPKAKKNQTESKLLRPQKVLIQDITSSSPGKSNQILQYSPERPSSDDQQEDFEGESTMKLINMYNKLKSISKESSSSHKNGNSSKNKDRHEDSEFDIDQYRLNHMLHQQDFKARQVLIQQSSHRRSKQSSA